MPCHYQEASSTHRILRDRGIVSSSNTGILGLRPLRRRRSRILALTVRVDIIVRIAGHWEEREARRPDLIYRIDRVGMREDKKDGTDGASNHTRNARCGMK